MGKEFHIWFCTCHTGEINCNTLFDIEIALNEGLTYIHTYQVQAVSTSLIEMGYRIFVHPHKGPVFEITLGACANTDREIRLGHSLNKMLVNGVFDTETTCVTGLE